LLAKFHLPSMPGGGSSMVGGQREQKNSGELEASLAPAEAQVGAVAKADQKKRKFIVALCLLVSAGTLLGSKKFLM
jgi:hypothetical protein